jgi:glycosyltransferase involved in cell wall biosynthesis
MDPSTGGPPRVVAGQALSLAARGARPEVATMHTPGQEAKAAEAWPELTEAGVPIHEFLRDRPSVLGRSRGLNQFLTRRIEGFDALHLQGLWERCLVDGARIARRTSVPYVIAPLGMTDRWSMSQSRLKKRLAMAFGAGNMMMGAAGFQFGTEDEASEAAGLPLGGSQFIIPNGLHLEHFNRVPGKDTGPLLAQFPFLRDGHPVLLFFSRFHPKKGLDLLLEAFATVAPAFPEARLLAAGISDDESYEAQLRARATAPDLRGKVAITAAFTGGAAAAAINAADVFVLPSHQEGFSMAVIEAAAYELPLLLTDRCHLPEVAAHGIGSVVPPTVEGLEFGLNELLGKDRAELVNMGRRGRAWAEAEFSWSRIARDLEDMYRSVGTGRERPRR